MKKLSKYFVFLIFLYVLWYLGFGYFSFLLFFVILCVICLCLLLSLRPMKKTTITLQLNKDHCIRDEKIDMTFFRQNHTPIQCGQVIVEYQLVDAFLQVVKESKVFIHDQQVNHEIKCQHCGHYTIKIKQIRCYDLLQCFSFSKAVTLEAGFDVLPQYHNINSSLNDVCQNNEEGEHYSPYHKGDDYSEIFEIRKYREGDDLRHIHWNMASKFQELFVKDGSQPVEKKLILAMEYKDNNTFYDQQFDYFYSLSLSLLKNHTDFEVITSIDDHHACLQSVDSPAKLMTVMKWMMKHPIMSLDHLAIDQPFCLINGQNMEVYHR